MENPLMLKMIHKCLLVDLSPSNFIRKKKTNLKIIIQQNLANFQADLD